ncbi:MAG: L-lactate dehydrogenase [Pseudomonadota bacterium]
MKIGIVGAGMVGSTTAFALVLNRIGREIVLVDNDAKRAAAEAEDIVHAAPFAHAMTVRSGGFADLDGAAIVVLAAGVSQQPGETRIELLGRNVAVFRAIIPSVLEVTPDAILLIATNPVDIMTQVATRIAGLSPNRVIGSGTILDTARFRVLLGQHLDVSAKSIHAHVLGEHGDSEVLHWSGALAGTMPIDQFADQIGRPLTSQVRAEIKDGVRLAAYRIIEGKGATYYGIGAGLSLIIRAILGDERRLLTVSIVSPQSEGLGDVAMSLPRVVGRGGVTQSLSPDLTDAEEEALTHSATVLKQALDSLQAQ